jgi:hypothetical protein
MSNSTDKPLINPEDLDQGFKLIDAIDKTGRHHSVAIYDIPWREAARIRAAIPSLGADAPGHILIYSLTHEKGKRIGTDEDADALLTKLAPEAIAELELVALAFFLGDEPAKKMRAAALTTLAQFHPATPTDSTLPPRQDSSPEATPSTTAELFPSEPSASAAN